MISNCFGEDFINEIVGGLGWNYLIELKEGKSLAKIVFAEIVSFMVTVNNKYDHKIKRIIDYV